MCTDAALKASEAKDTTIIQLYQLLLEVWIIMIALSIRHIGSWCWYLVKFGMSAHNAHAQIPNHGHVIIKFVNIAE